MIDSLPSLIRALSERGISTSGRDGVEEWEAVLGELGGVGEQDTDSTASSQRSNSDDREGAGSRGDCGVKSSMKKLALVSIQLSSLLESSRAGSLGAWGCLESLSAPVCLSAGM